MVGECAVNLKRGIRNRETGETRKKAGRLLIDEA